MLQPKSPSVMPRALPTSPYKKQATSKQATVVSSDRVASTVTSEVGFTPVPPSCSLSGPVTWVAPPVVRAVNKNEKEMSEGFNQFRNTLYHLLEKIEAPTLQSKWEAVRHHLETYDNEEVGEQIKENIKSLLHAHSASPPVPDLFTCFHWLLGLLLRYNMGLAPYLAQIEAYLLDCVYVMPPRPPELGYEAPDVEQLRSVFGEKTYAQALKQYSTKMARDINDAENDIKKRIKLSAILNKVISYWQTAFLGKILCSWNNYIKHSKNSSQLNKQIEHLEKSIGTAEAQVVSLTNKGEEEAAAAAEKLRTTQIQLEVEIKKRKKDSDNYEEQIRELETQVKHLIAQRNEAEARAAEGEKLNTILTTATKLDTTDHETMLQNKLLAAGGGLVAWCNALLESSDTYKESNLPPFTDESLYEGSTSKHLLVLLKIMAPKLISDTTFRAAMSHTNPVKVCEAVMELGHVMGLTMTLFTPTGLASDGVPGRRSRMCLLTVLGVRVLAGRAEGQDSFYGNTVVGGWFKSTVRPSPTEWTQTVTTLQERQKQLKSLLQMNLVPILKEYVQTEGGSALSKCEVRDKGEFVDGVDPESYDDLLEEGCNKDEETLKIRSVLDDNYRVLRNVYLYYGATDTSSSNTEIDKKEFAKLMKDCGLKSSANKIWATANTDKEDSMLTPSEYSTALIRCVAVAGDTKKPLSERFGDLVSKVIIPKANYTSIEEFKTQLSAATVQNALLTYTSPVRRVFKYYAKKGGLEKEAALSYPEFQHFCNDIRIIDTNCTHLSLKHMFLALQDDVQTTRDPTLDMQEFKSILVGLACFKYPAPYIPLYQKAKNFLHSVFASSGNLAAIVKF